MALHAHPIEYLWAILALLALGGAIHSTYLATEDRAFARLAVLASEPGAVNRLRVACLNMWSEVFRLMLTGIMMCAASFALVAEPGTMRAFLQFPQTLMNIIAGCLSSVVIIVWASLDVYVRRSVVPAPEAG